MLRGNDGQDIFRSDADRCRLHLLLQEGTCRFGYRLNAFCLMSNRLLVTPQTEIALARGIGLTNQVLIRPQVVGPHLAKPVLLLRRGQ